MADGHVVEIWIAPEAKAPMTRVAEVKAVAGSGLEGDRYAAGLGSWSQNPGGGRHVTLIEREAIEAILRESEIALEPGATRRNLVTTGVALNHLVGREFRVGDVKLVGVRLCEPCADLAKSIGAPVVQPLLHRAGLRAEIVEGGTIRVGDEVVSLSRV